MVRNDKLALFDCHELVVCEILRRSVESVVIEHVAVDLDFGCSYLSLGF